MSCKKGPETRGTCLEKMLARKENPSREVEERRSWVVFEGQKASPVIGQSEQGRDAGPAIMLCPEGSGKGLILDPKSRLCKKEE